MNVLQVMDRYQKEVILHCSCFFLHFQLIRMKNVKKAYFNQHLECVAPKCWLKYSTLVLNATLWKLKLSSQGFLLTLVKVCPKD